MKKILKLFTLAFILMFAITVKVDAASCTDDCVAQVGTEKYATVQEAITAVADGGTVELLAGEITEEIKTGRINKSFTIVGAANHATVLKNGIYVGGDNSSLDVLDITVTIKGIAFKDKGIKVGDIKNVNIEDNKLENITGNEAIIVLDSGIHDTKANVVIKNNYVDGAYQGIRIRNGYNIEIVGNTIKNTDHNAITIEHGSKWSGNDGTVVIDNNTFENWALGGEGRVVRAAFGSATQLEKEIAFTGNKMIRDEEPAEEYAKLTNVGTKAVDFEKNYWNSDNPDFEKILSVEGGNKEVKIDEYYKEETMRDEDLNTYVEPPKVEEETKKPSNETTGAQAEDIENPETSDNILVSIVLASVSSVAIVGYVVYNKKRSYN